MREERNRRTDNARRNRTVMVEGNTVRKLSVVPMPRQTPEQEEPDRRRKTKEKQTKTRQTARPRRQERGAVARSPHREQVREKHFGFGYVLVLAVCAALSLWVCVGYLQMQAENTKLVKQIAALENQLTEKKTENDDAYSRLVGSVDLNHIREVAIQELGMVYADANQIVLYDNKTNDYVRQYGEVPQEEKGILDSLLGSK